MSTIFPLPGGDGSNGSSVDCSTLSHDIQQYTSYVTFWTAKVRSANGPVEQQSAQDILDKVSTTLSELQATYTEHCLLPLPPPKPFDAGTWELVTPLGIQLDETGQVWDTGSIWTVLPVEGNRLLIGTENGGLWLSEPDTAGGYKSACLSDSWQHWQINTMLADPRNPSRVFVGTYGGGFYVGESSSFSILDKWTCIPLPLSLRGANILSMIILPASRLVVLATDRGVAWSPIDSPGSAWHTQLVYANDLANLKEDAFILTVADAGWDGVVLARITSSSLSSSPVPPKSISWSTTPTAIRPLRVGSCRTTPSTVYCVGTCQGGSTANLFILRSQDNGLHWEECGYRTTTADDLSTALDIGDDGVKSRMGVAVHPTRPEVVAIGYLGAAFSFDSGTSWDNQIFGFPGRHGDVHEITFVEQTDVVHIPSDGGLVTVSNWENATSARGDTLRNKTLPVVMLYSPANWLNFYGTLSVGEYNRLIAAGSQDNAILWSTPGSAWQELGGGDGGSVVVGDIEAQPVLLYCLNANGVAASWDTWENTSWLDHGVVPIRLSPQSFPPIPPGVEAVDEDGLIAVMRAVPSQSPIFIKPPGGGHEDLRVLAVGSPDHPDINGNIVYGAAFYPASTKIEWLELGRVPPGERITALEPYSGSSVLAGTLTGRLFEVNVSGVIHEVQFPDSLGSQVLGIASFMGSILVIRQDRTTAAVNHLYRRVFAGDPLQLIPPSEFPPNGKAVFRGVAVNRNPKFSRFAYAVSVAESEVWVSSYFGSGWHKAVNGLPTAVRCADVVFSNLDSGGELFLSTYGRGVWRLSFSK